MDGVAAVGVNKPVMVGLAKTLVLGGSPKRPENHKKNVSKNFDWKASNRWIEYFFGSHPLLAVGVGGAVLGARQRPRYWALLQILTKTAKKKVQKKSQMGT